MKALGQKPKMLRLSLGPMFTMLTRMSHRAQDDRQLKPRGYSLVLGLMLAMLAMINVMAISSWHSSIVGHDDAKIASALVLHDDNAPAMPEVDLHQMTHTVINGLADISPSNAVVSVILVAVGIWFITRDDALSGPLTEAILRPPRG